MENGVGVPYEADEVFEEADNHSLDAFASASSDDLSRVDGIVNEDDEVMQDAMDLPDGFQSEDNQETSSKGDDDDDDGISVASVEQLGISVLTAEEKLEEGDSEEMVSNGTDTRQLKPSDELLSSQNANEMNTELSNNLPAPKETEEDGVFEESDDHSLDSVITTVGSDVEEISSKANNVDEASKDSTAKSAYPALPSLRPAHVVRFAPQSNASASNPDAEIVEEPEEVDETCEKLQMIRVKFLRVAQRLGQTPHNDMVAQVLYRIGLAEQLRGGTNQRGSAFSFDRASAKADQLEQTKNEPLDFSCTILVLGKTGAGKSATINSLLDEVKLNTNAFGLGTKKVEQVEGTIEGIKVRIIDTPGLFASCSEQGKNVKILNSVKKLIKKTPPDIVLYLDRLDVLSRDSSDLLLLKTVSDVFGSSIWLNAIVGLTHAASAPPEGPNGTALSYDKFVSERSYVVQKAIRQAAGDKRLMNPVCLVENHSACRSNRAGQRVLPDGQVWRPHLLLLSFASKILSEANALLKSQEIPPSRPYAMQPFPLPWFLSSFLQSRNQVKLPDEQFGEEDDLEELSDSDEESDQYDELPSFRPLTKAQLAKLTKEHKKAYYDEVEYREKLFMKKQLKEERERRKMMKKMAELAKDMPVKSDEYDGEDESDGSIAMPMPDPILPASFGSDNPTHRYRALDDKSNQWLVGPHLNPQGWDHDVGYEGINVERLMVIKGKIPVSLAGQIVKDKKEARSQMAVAIASSVKHGEGKGTTLGFDMQSVRDEIAYTLRSDTLFSNRKRNKASAGISLTRFGDAMSAGLKLEDKLVVNKLLRVEMSGGAMSRGRGDTIYGGSLEARLMLMRRFLSSLGMSVMEYKGGWDVNCSVQSHIPVGRGTNLVARANVNRQGSGQVSIRLNSSEQTQIALIGLIPLLKKLVDQCLSFRRE